MARNLGYPTFARELLAARARLTLGDEVGLALRAHRRRLRLSQRDYAAARGYSRATLGRLESAAGRHRLDDVVAALDGTGFALYVGRAPTPPSSGQGALPSHTTALPDGAPRAVPLTGSPAVVTPDSWPRTELLARVRGGRRRFPGHLEATQVDWPPPWWWVQEFFDGSGDPPHWYSPRPWEDIDGNTVYPLAPVGDLVTTQAEDCPSAEPEVA